MDPLAPNGRKLGPWETALEGSIRTLVPSWVFPFCILGTMRQTGLLFFAATGPSNHMLKTLKMGGKVNLSPLYADFLGRFLRVTQSERAH